MTAKGKNFLKVSGGLSIFIGLIVVFVGFYIMANGMAINSVDKETEQEVLKTMKYLSAGGMYMMVFGGYSIYAGFIGLLNASDTDCIDKLKKLGLIYLALCILNIIIIFLISYNITIFTILVCLIPLIIALMYMLGVMLNIKKG